MKDAVGATVEIDLEPGDAIMYRGADLIHWRDPSPHDWLVQVFLHYVDLNGPTPRSVLMVDQRLALGGRGADMTEYRHALPPLPNPHQRTVATSPLLECKRMCSAAGTHARRFRLDRRVGQPPGVTDGIVDREVRSAGLFPLPTDGGWPFDRLVEAIADHNSATFRFDLDGIYESDRPAVAKIHRRRVRPISSSHRRRPQATRPANCHTLSNSIRERTTRAATSSSQTWGSPHPEIKALWLSFRQHSPTPSPPYSRAPAM